MENNTEYGLGDTDLEEKPIDEILKASPAAKRLARELGVSLHEVAGTGPGGRIVESDVKKAFNVLKEREPKIRISPLALKVMQQYKIQAGSIKGSGIGGKIIKTDVLKAAGVIEQQGKNIVYTPEEVAVSSGPTPEEKNVKLSDIAYDAVPYTGVRKVIGERMWQSVQTAPHFTLTTEVNVEGFVKLRTALNDTLKAHGQPGVSYTDILVKVVALALKQHPNVNAFLVQGQIQRMKEVNIGVATALPNGLIVPVVVQADRKTIPRISLEVKDLTSRAREGKLTSGEVSGSTFTISNLGMYDIDGFTPIINQPESAILGVGRMVEKAVVENGAIVVKPAMVLSLSVDHRVNDGVPAALFLKEIKSMLQDPYKILLRI